MYSLIGSTTICICLEQEDGACACSTSNMLYTTHHSDVPVCNDGEGRGRVGGKTTILTPLPITMHKTRQLVEVH